MARISRSKWGARPHTPGPGKPDPRKVRGMVIHWPGMSTPLRGVPAVSAALRSWQDMHMDDNGWSDIAYQEAIDQDGNSYVLRGFWTEPGANGDAQLNDTLGAILLVLAPGEKPTAAMLRTLRKRLRRFREVYPRAHRVYGHGEVRPEPTACPGAIVQGLISEGVIR